MFNHEAYNERLKQIRVVVEMAIMELNREDHAAWEAEVSFRYARFLAHRAFEQMERCLQAFGGYDIVPDKQKHREYCAAELMGVVSGIHASSAMMRGAVKCADAVGAEAMMRIYDEANTQKVGGSNEDRIS